MSTRDVYDAEHEVGFILENGGTVEFYGSKLTVPQEARFGDLASVQRYVDKACEHVAFPNPPRVRRRRGNRWAHYERDTHTIAVPDHAGSRSSWAMREMVVLHELAHAMTPGHGHDTVFCSKLVELVERCIAPEAGLLLAAAFGERGVHVKKTTV